MTAPEHDDLHPNDAPSLAGQTASAVVLLVMSCLLAIGAVVAIEHVVAALLPSFGE